jgi:DNA/RNA endonuclease YhcR with UshA esterase domain
MPLSAAEAANRINEPVTVEMLVKAAKNCQHCSQVFLDSEEDHHDPRNLAVAVTEIGKAKFREAKIDDPANHFAGHVIRVSGVVTLKDDRPRVDVDDPGQIEVVERKK